MVRIDITYEGGLHTVATHAPSGAQFPTDAPVDNHGKGEAFSPTDLMAASLGTCMITVMGIVAERHAWDITGSTVTVEKSMITEPARRIGKLDCVIRVPHDFDAKTRAALERAAHNCPVHKTLEGRVDMPLRFEWGGA